MAWDDGLTADQRKEISLAEYMRDHIGYFPTTGISRMELIAELAKRLKNGYQGPVPDYGDRFVLWDCDHQSQWDKDADDTKKDCGPACVETVCKYVTGNVTGPGTNEIMRFITGGTDRSTSLSELQKAAKELYGVTMTRHDGASIAQVIGWINAKRPPIILVKYGYFIMRLDRKYESGHFMVAVGRDRFVTNGVPVERIYVHDPDWWDPYMGQGAFIPVTHHHFFQMWDGAKDDKGPGWQNPARAALVPVL